MPARHQQKIVLNKNKWLAFAPPSQHARTGSARRGYPRIPSAVQLGHQTLDKKYMRQQLNGQLPLRFTRTAIVLHWLIALLLLGQFVFGWLLADIPRNTPERGYFINLHKSTGILIGVLIVLRLVWRLRHRPPALPSSMRQWQQRAASASHIGLYAGMLIMPLSGYLAANFSKHGIKFLNIYKWAPWGSDDKLLYTIFNQTHKITALLLAALISLHVLAVVKHALIDRDSLFSRMWPRAAVRH